MADSLLIRGGRIIDPSREIDRTGDLLVRDGKIAVLVDVPPSEDDYAVLNASGFIVCPGFIDLHCHLRQPGFEEKETIATGTRAAARGGFTTVCCMPNTRPPVDSESMINYVKTIAAREAVIRVFPIGCVTIGRKGEELADLNEMEMAGAVAFSDDGAPVGRPEIMRRALEYSRDFRRPVIDHCEDLSLSRDGQINEGIVALELGLPGIPAAAEELMVKRDIDLARETGGHMHIAHVSTSGSADLIRAAKEEGVPVTAEVSPHHLTLTDEAVLKYGTLAKVNPPLRTKQDTLALLRALSDGVIDIVATDHAPHTTADKAGEFARAASGISGLETALGSLVELVLKSELSLNNLIAALTIGPARVLGFEKLGTLESGAPADICIFDLHKEWIVDVSKFASKGKNTPLAGQRLRGKVMATIYQGNPVYMDESLRIKDKYEI
ncbi:MAG: dihydroorotase [Chloroflexi bacterium RBG_16_56_11]|nr:MAG: dihydroorotase [Chloroflexi bacterium RBG_16_56_11]